MTAEVLLEHGGRGSTGSSISSQCSSDSAECRHVLIRHIHNKVNRHPPALFRPHSLTFLNNGDLATAEGFWPYSRVQIFTIKNLYRSSYSIGQGEILPYAVTSCTDGTNSSVLAVTDHRDRTVKFLSSSATSQSRSKGRSVVESWRPSMFEWPTGICTDGRGYHYVADWSRGTVSVCDTHGTCVQTLRTVGQSSTESSCPVDVCVDSHNRLIVSDSYDQTVKVFDGRGRYLLRVGELTGRGRVIDPRGVCIDERKGQTGRILVADWGDRAVKAYDTDGRYLEDVLSESDGVKNPYGVALSAEGYLAISEHRLRIPPAVKVYSLL